MEQWQAIDLSKSPWYRADNRFERFLLSRLGSFKIVRFLLGGTWQKFGLGRLPDGTYMYEWKKMTMKLSSASETEEYS